MSLVTQYIRSHWNSDELVIDTTELNIYKHYWLLGTTLIIFVGGEIGLTHQSHQFMLHHGLSNALSSIFDMKCVLYRLSYPEWQKSVACRCVWKTDPTCNGNLSGSQEAFVFLDEWPPTEYYLHDWRLGPSPANFDWSKIMIRIINCIHCFLVGCNY